VLSAHLSDVIVSGTFPRPGVISAGIYKGELTAITGASAPTGFAWQWIHFNPFTNAVVSSFDIPGIKAGDTPVLGCSLQGDLIPAVWRKARKGIELFGVGAGAFVKLTGSMLGATCSQSMTTASTLFALVKVKNNQFVVYSDLARKKTRKGKPLPKGLKNPILFALSTALDTQPIPAVLASVKGGYIVLYQPSPSVWTRVALPSLDPKKRVISVQSGLLSMTETWIGAQFSGGDQAFATIPAVK
jgi:hypothetical protein